MSRNWLVSMAAGALAFGIYGLTPSQAQVAAQATPESLAETAATPGDATECTFFGAGRDRFAPRINLAGGTTAGRLTRMYAASGGFGGRASGGARAQAFTTAATGNISTNLIDKYIFAALQSNGVTPAAKTDDYEFIRRVTLDLTGRIPTAARVTQFVADASATKRAALIDELLAKPEWVDKWTMFYGDRFKNTAANVQILIRPEGRNAFYKFIKDSLTAGKPYNQMVSEMIAAQGNNSFDQANGQLNYLPLGVVGGGPAQDIYDSQAANVAETFLGMAHVNCVLCHNGRGHLDTLSLWGSQTTRTQAWGLSAFFAKTNTARVNLPLPANNYYYWTLTNPANAVDYALNTTTGNRPSRTAIGATRNITPSYMFTGKAPAAGQEYRAAMAQFVTGDFQFARASVNYIWAEYFGTGIVDPPDQFDPARLDPNNPPPAPWTLQPSNPALLNALAQSFIDSGYNVKALMRLIANSDTYQLASEYSGTWSPAWDQFFGRHNVRRMWGEEIHDSVVTAIGTVPSYTVPGFTLDSVNYPTSLGFGKISWAMQSPDVVNMPDGGGAVSQFIDSFLRGNRDDQPRKSEGSILQTLNLMNDNFIESRIKATGTGTSASFLQAQLNLYPSDNAGLITALYLNVLSRKPTATEISLASAQLLKAGQTRSLNAEDLLWTMLNKLDFVFNY